MADQPHFDCTRVMPELAEIRSRVQAMDYSGLSTQLIALQERDERLLPAACSVAVEEPSLAPILADRLRNNSDDILAKALQAHRGIVRGWEIRSGLGAAHVSREQFEQFHSHLRRSEASLIQLCAQEPVWTYPWYLRLISARGLELGQSETRRRYDRLADLDPHHYPGQSQLLQTLCPKWGGNWEEAFGFARACSAAAPQGSPVHGIIARVHLEQWIDIGDKKGGDYLRRPDVLDEVRRAATASVFHPDFEPGFTWVSLHSVFGVVFALAGDQASAARHFAVLGDVVDDGVWGYLTTSLPVVQRARKAGLAAVGAA